MIYVICKRNEYLFNYVQFPNQLLFIVHAKKFDKTYKQNDYFIQFQTKKTMLHRRQSWLVFPPTPRPCSTCKRRIDPESTPPFLASSLETRSTNNWQTYSKIREPLPKPLPDWPPSLWKKPRFHRPQLPSRPPPQGKQCHQWQSKKILIRKT